MYIYKNISYIYIFKKCNEKKVAYIVTKVKEVINVTAKANTHVIMYIFSA